MSRMGFNLFNVIGWQNAFYVFRHRKAGFYGFWRYFLKDTFWGWMVKIYHLYMKGAKANDFPMNKYGLFGKGEGR